MSNVGLVFDASSFDNFNKSLEKFKKISVDVDTRLEKIAIATKNLDDKKLNNFSKSLINLANAINSINKSTVGMENLNNIFDIFQKFSTTHFRVPDFSPFVKTINELSKLNSLKIKASLDNLNSVTNIFTGEGFGTALEKAADKTKVGSLNLKDAFTNLKSAFKTLDVGSFFNTINPFAKSLDIFGSSTGGILGKLRMFSNNDIEKLASFTRSLGSVFDSLKRIAKIDIDMNKLQSNLEAMKIFVTSFSGESAISRLGKVFSGIASSFSGDISGIKLSGGGIFGKLGAFFKSNSLKGVLDFLKPNGIVSQFKNFNTNQVEGFRKFANSIRDITLAFSTISEISGNVRNIDEEGLKEFVESFGFVQNIMRSLISSFTGGSFIDKAFNLFRSIGTGNTEGIVRGVASLFGNNGIIAELSRFNIPTISAFKDFSNSIKDIINSINEFKNARVDDAAFNTLQNGVEKIVRLFVGNKSFFPFFNNTGLIRDINSLGKSKLEGFKLFAESIEGILRSIAKISVNDIDENIFSKIGIGIKSSIPLFKDISKQLKGMDLKALENFSKTLSRVISAAISKTRTDIRVDGIEEKFEEQGEKSGLGFLSGFKKALGIRSPSRELFEAGTEIIAGLVNGLKSNNDLEKIINNIKDSLTSGISSIGNKLKSLINISQIAKDSNNIGEIIGNNLGKGFVKGTLILKNLLTTDNIFTKGLKASVVGIGNLAIGLANGFTKGFFSQIGNEIKGKFEGIFRKNKAEETIYEEGQKSGTSFVKGLTNTIISGLKAAAITTVIGGSLFAIGSTIVSFVTADLKYKLGAALIKILFDLSPFIARGIAEGFVLGSQLILNTIKLLANTVGKLLINVIKLLGISAKAAFSFFVKSTVNGLKNIENGFKTLLSIGKNLVSSIFERGRNAASSFLSALSPSNIINSLENIGRKVFYIRQIFDDLYNTAKRFYDLTIGVSVDFESAFTGVLKTLSIPPEILAQGGEAVAAFEQSIRDTINTMATAPDSLLSGLDNAFVTLSGIAENAGALGIAGDQVAAFTEVVGQLTLATDLTADAASSFIAIFSTVTGNQSFQQLGGAITALGNSSAATESQIAEISGRIVGVGNAAGLTESQILGWGAAIRSLGIEAELGGTAFNTLVTEITSASAQGGSELNQFAELAGMSAAEFAEAWETDASGALQGVIEGLGELDNASRIQVLDNLGLDGARMTQFISLISSNTEELNRILGVAEESFVVFGDSVEDFNALQEETARRSATTASNLARVSNVAKGLGDIIGQFFLPAFNEALTSISLTLTDFGSILTENREVIQEVIDSATSSVGFLLEAFGNLFNAVMQFFSVFTGGQNPVLFFFSRIGDFIKFISFQILQFAKAIDSVATRISSVSGAMLNILGFGLDTNLDGMKKVSDEYAILADGIEIVNGLLSDQNTTLPQTTDYLIEQGDTLSEIAARYGTTVDELVRLNNIENPNLIIAGTTIQIPSSTSQTLQNAADSTTTITENLGEISATVDQTLRDMTKLFEPTTLEDFKQIAIDILNEFGNIGTELTNIKNNFDGLISNFNPANARKFGTSLGNSLGNIAKSFGSILANLFGGTGNIEFSPVFTNIRDSFYAILEGLFNLPEGELNRIVTPFVTELFSFIGNIFNLLITAGTGGDINESFTAIQENISNAASGLTTVFIEAIRGAFENLPELIRTGAGAAAAIIGAFVGIATAIIDGIGEAFNQLSEEEKTQLAGQLVTVLIVVAGLMATVGAIAGLGSAILGAIAAGLTALGLSGVAIVALAIALGAAMVAAIVSPEFRQELGTALEDTIDGLFGEGTYDEFQLSIQNALVDAGLAAGNTILAFMDTIKAQALFIIENLANGFADILEAAHLTDQANALRNSVSAIGTEADILTLQAEIRTGGNPALTTLIEAFNSGQALGLEVNVIAGEIDERVQELLTIAANQGSEGISNEIEILLDMGISLETINANLQALGLTPEQITEITNNLIESGALNLEDVPIFIEGFDVQIPEANLANTLSDARSNVLNAIGLGTVEDSDAVQLFVDGEITFEELTVAIPDEETRNAAIQTAFDTAATTGDLFTLQYLTLTASEFDIQLDSESLITAIETGALSDEDILEIAPSLRIGFENAAFSFTPEQMERLTTELSESALTNLNMSAVGGDLINGIIDGVEAENPELLESISSSAQGVLDEYDNVWRIESPSQVMIEKGKFLMQGLAMGMQIGYLLVNEAFMMITNSQLMLEEETLLHIERMIESYEEFAGLMKDISSKITKYIQNMSKETTKAFSSMVSASSALKYNLTANLIALKPILDATTAEIYELGDAFYFVVLKAAQAQTVMNNAINQANTAINNGGTSGGTSGNEGLSPVGGGRKFGGDVFAGNIYEILEGNLPFEIFRTNNRTFFLPNVGGEMISPFGNNTASMFQPQMDSRISNNYGGNSTVINVPVQIDGISGDITDARIDEISERISKNVSAGLNTANNQESLTRRLNRRGKS